MAGSKKSPAVTPELLRHVDLAEVTPPARLLYLGMRAMAVDGRLEATPRQLKAAVLPSDDVDVAELLRQLQAWKLVVSTDMPNGFLVRELDVRVAKPKKAAPQMTESRAELVRLVFVDYQRIMGKPQAKLDDKRRVVINRALDSGFTARQLAEAIHGYTFSRFHMGENDRNRRYDDIELLLRDAKHIEEGLELYHRGNGPQPNGGGNGGRQKRPGASPHERWNALADGAPGAGGLPADGKGPPQGTQDSGGLAPGADAGKQREAGPSLFDGLRCD